MPRIRNILHILLYLAAAIGYLPLAPYLGMIPRLAIPAAIIFAAFADKKELVVRERSALVLSLAAFLYYALQFSRHNVVQPAAEMLAIFLAIRLIGEKSPRNFMQTLTLAMFCLAASSLFDLSPGFIFYLIGLLLVFTVSMVLLTFESRAAEFMPGRRELRSIVFVALLHPLVASPLILLLFFILPRTQLPVWQGLTRAGADRSGISESVRAGEKGSISSASAVVFRAETARLPSYSLYWRVIVLNSLKGEEWIRLPPPAEKSILSNGRGVTVNIFLEPGRLHYLPALNIPDKITGYRTQPHDDRIFPAQGLAGRSRGYSVFSQADAKLSTTGSINGQFYLSPPPNAPGRLKSLVSEAVADSSDSRERLERVKDLFASLSLSYASSGLPTGSDAMDRFLFGTKKGHCELFALSFATALRLAGLPSRLVGGYYGGDYNDMAGYYVVTEEMAHLWVEVWIEGQGWITVDPSRFAVNFEESVRKKRSPLALRLRLALDSLSYYWNRGVITYDFETQIIAANRAGEKLKGMKELRFNAGKAGTYLALLLLTGAVTVFLTTRRRTAEERLLARFKRVAGRRYNIEFPPSSGLHEAVGHIDSAEVKEFVKIYTEAIYRDKKLSQEEQKLLSGLLRRIGKTVRVH